MSAIVEANKLKQTVPTYQKIANAHTKMAQQGLISVLSAAEKEREALKKLKDLHAQQSTVAALSSTITAQQKKVSQMQSAYKSDLQKDLAEVGAKIAQLQPTLDKSIYKEGLMELKAPQNGVIKDLATTTVGAVVQPGSVVMTLVPKGEQLYADVSVKNEDVGFIRVGQTAQIKLATYPFQRFGMMKGTVILLSPDSNELNKANDTASTSSSNKSSSSNASTQGVMTYKARIRLDAQTMTDPQGSKLTIGSGMQVVAEINQGQRTVLEYLLSPVQKAVQEAGRER